MLWDTEELKCVFPPCWVEKRVYKRENCDAQLKPKYRSLQLSA